MNIRQKLLYKIQIKTFSNQILLSVVKSFVKLCKTIQKNYKANSYFRQNVNLEILKKCKCFIKIYNFQ